MGPAPQRGVADRTGLLLTGWLALAVAVLTVLPTPPPTVDGDALPAERFAIVDALVFDGERFLPHRDVWVEDGRIRAVGRRLDLPTDLPRLDGRGRTVLPGLVDAHVHTFGTLLEDALRFGVTTVLDQFTAPAKLAAAKATRTSIGHEGRADLFSAGVLATAPGGHGTQYGLPVATVTVETDPVAWVRERKAEGSDWIKIVIEDGGLYGAELPTLGPETVAALVAAAHGEGLLAVAHVSTLADAERAAAAGVDGLVHVWADTVIDGAGAEALAEAGLFVVPTLAVIASVAGQPVTEALTDGSALSPMQRETVAGQFPTPRSEDLERALENVRRLHAAGVPILAGTDAPNPGTASGVSLHAELELLARAGLAPAAVLEAATAGPARAFAIDDRGRLADGQLADLVLIAGDPTADLAATRAIVGVWKDGIPVDRAASAPAAADQAIAPAPDATLVADFEGGLDAAFGAGWCESTDALRGGASVAELAVADGHLSVTGEIRAGFAFPWAGAIWFPGSRPMAPVAFTGRTTLRFRVRGDGRPYAVMVFGENPGAGVPPMATFDTTDTWQTLSFPLDRFGDDRVISGVAFVAQQPTGPFRFALDDLELF